MRLADALLAATVPVSAPVTPLVGTSHHHLHPSTQPLVAGVAQPHLQLGPRQLDFGVGPKQAWQTCSPMDATPSTMCTLSPITPAPRVRPVLHGGRHQTVFENETPDRPQHPVQQFHAYGQQHFIAEERQGYCRYPSPVVSRHESRAPTTPPRTPPRRFLVEVTTEGVGESESGIRPDPSSAQRHHSPPSSVAKTPSYGMWVRSTPSPQGMYRGMNAFADTSSHMSGDSRSQSLVDVPPMLPQQLQFSMHATHAMPWGMFPSAC